MAGGSEIGDRGDGRSMETNRRFQIAGLLKDQTGVGERSGIARVESRRARKRGERLLEIVGEITSVAQVEKRLGPRGIEGDEQTMEIARDEGLAFSIDRRPPDRSGIRRSSLGIEISPPIKRGGADDPLTGLRPLVSPFSHRHAATELKVRNIHPSAAEPMRLDNALTERVWELSLASDAARSSSETIPSLLVSSGSWLVELAEAEEVDEAEDDEVEA